MVLPDRIELSTSPLPMECSTTELRQHARIRESAETAPTGGPILATRPPLAQAREQPAGHPKQPKSARQAGSRLHWLDCGPIRFPIWSGTGGKRPCGRKFSKNHGAARRIDKVAAELAVRRLSASGTRYIRTMTA